MVPQGRPQRNHWLRHLETCRPRSVATLSTVTVRQRIVVALLIGAVALAFADASVVALALPDLYGEFDTTIVGVSWVLTTYALAVAIASVPVAVLHRRVRTTPPRRRRRRRVHRRLPDGRAGDRPRRAARRTSRSGRRCRAAARRIVAGPRRAGARPRAGASMVGARRCGRCGDRTGARWSVDRTVLVAGDLPRPGADRRRRVGAWPPTQRARVSRDPAGDGVHTTSRTDVTVANVGFALVFAALVAALFLGVLMAIEVWRYDPPQSALLVSALPLGMLLGRARASRRPVPRSPSAARLLLAAGLVVLAFVPGAAPVAPPWRSRSAASGSTSCTRCSTVPPYRPASHRFGPAPSRSVPATPASCSAWR